MYMNKRCCILALTCTLVLAAASGRAQVRSGSATTPVSARGLSPVTPPSVHQNPLVPSRPAVAAPNVNDAALEHHFLNPRRYGPPPSLGSGLSAPSPADSFIPRSASLPRTDRSPSALQHDGGLDLTQPGASRLAKGRSYNRQSSLTLSNSGIYRPKSMLSMSPEELQRLSGLDLLTDAVRLPTDSMLQDRLTIEPPGRTPVEPVLRPQNLQPEKSEPTTTFPPANMDTSYVAEPSVPLEPEAPADAKIQELKALLESDLDRTRTKTPDTASETDDWTSRPRQTTPEPETDRQALSVDNLGEQFTPAADKMSEPSNNAPTGELPQFGPDEKRVARSILGEHATYEQLAAAKADEFAAAADALLKEGKYYKAVDACVLGLIWQRNNPQLNLRRAIAHFAAGEFISAALFLERAVTLQPSCADSKIDLAALLPSADVIDNQLIDGAKWQEEFGSAEIAMLLAWVCHQQGRSASAANYIQFAQRKLPDNPAVATIAAALAPK
jgi:tetratricopeptide (TPR) repeat protein